MKNKTFTYINTGNTNKQIVVDYVDQDGAQKRTVIILKPKQVLSDSLAKVTIGGNRNTIVNVSVSGSPVRSTLSSSESILKRSAVLDIETSGRLGPNSITQIGIYNVADKRATAIFPSVNSIINPAPGELSYKRIQSGINPFTGSSFKAQKYIDMYMEMYPKEGKKQAKDLVESALKGSSLFGKSRLDLIEKRLIEQDFFQAEQMVSEENLRKYARDRVIDPTTGELYQSVKAKRLLYQAVDSGKIDESVLREHFKLGTGSSKVFDKLFSGGVNILSKRSMVDILNQDLPSALKDKVTWIANAPFESTQFGAQIDAQARESMIALNKARVEAGQTPVSEKNFIKSFSYGGYEEEIEKLNLTRAADQQLVTKNPMYGVTKGVSAMQGKPFYVTGSEFQRARRLAQKSGDYSLLYKALLETTTEGDVRDILDLPRMQQSMLIQSGDMTSSKVPTSVGVEVQARLYGFTEQLRKGKSFEEASKRLMQKELHSGIGDVALSETPILREALDQLEALEIERTGGPGLDKLREQAARGEGALFRAKIYGSLMDYLNNPLVTKEGDIIESLHDVQMKARAGRYAYDIATQGSYETREFTPGINRVAQVSPAEPGLVKFESHEVNRISRTRKTNFFELLDDVANLPEYESARKQEIMQQIKDHFKDTYDLETGEILKGREAEFKRKATILSESADSQIRSIEGHFASERFYLQEQGSIAKNVLLQGSGRTTDVKLAQNMTNNVVSNYSDFLNVNTKKIASKSKFNFARLGGYAALATGLAALSATRIEEPVATKSMLIGDSKAFLKSKAAQNQVSESEYKKAMMLKYNNIEGMSKQGVSSALRKLYTDFGSPYQNPGYSLSVLDDYNLRRERERYNSLEFANTHFSEKGSVGFQLKRFISSGFKDQLGTRIRIVESFAPPGNKINRAKYPGLTHNNLQEYDLSPSNPNYKISMEDADTLTVNSKGGKFSFRLAGIDAPETSHSGRAAQPFAEEAKALVQQMISQAKDVRMVVEPGDMTYGRQVGMLYADGRNINLELIKRGFAAYLPYKGKGKKQLYNAQAFEEAQERAYTAKRGMWQSPFFQAYKMMSDKTGQSITFNTLANVSKVAQNASLMSIYSTMNQAQEMGMVNNAMQIEIASIGDQMNSNKKPFAPDSKKGGWTQLDLQSYGENNNSILSVLDQQKYEIGRLMRTRNSKNLNQKFKSGKFNKNNLAMTNETLAKNVYDEENKIKILQDKRRQQLNTLRIKKMERMQQQALGNQFNSPIGHHRM